MRSNVESLFHLSLIHIFSELPVKYGVDQLNYENYRLETKNRSFLVIRLFMVLVLVKLPKGEMFILSLIHI